jgi:hypothetical protein
VIKTLHRQFDVVSNIVFAFGETRSPIPSFVGPAFRDVAEVQEQHCLFPLTNKMGEDIHGDCFRIFALHRPTVGRLPHAGFASPYRSVHAPISNILALIKHRLTSVDDCDKWAKVDSISPFFGRDNNRPLSVNDAGHPSPFKFGCFHSTIIPVNPYYCPLNPEYVKLAHRRIGAVACQGKLPLFAEDV